MPQKKQTNDASESKQPTEAELRKARRERRAKRASAKAAKVTSKSTAADRENAPVVKAIITKAQADRERKDHERKKEDALLSTVNWQWRKFALGLMNGLPNYKAYAEAYDMNDVERDNRQYQVAAVKSSYLLKNGKFRAFWRDLLEEQGFNDDAVDTEMVKLMTDPDTPPAVRRATIRDYNELKGRIVKKQSWTDDQGISLFDADNTSFEIRVVRPSK